VAIKISNLQQISELYKQKSYYYKDLHLDFGQAGNYSTQYQQQVDGNDVRVYYDESAIRNSLRNLFTTRPGQRFLFPRYGLDLDKYLFETVNEINGQMIGEAIVTAIRYFEPRVTVRKCNIIAMPEDNAYDITIIVEIPIINRVVPINTSLDVKGKSFVFLESSRTT